MIALMGAVMLCFEAAGVVPIEMSAVRPPAMAPSTALGFILAGGALLVHSRTATMTAGQRRVADGLAVAALGVLLLGELSPSIGVSRPAYNTLIAFALNGAALLLLDRRPRVAQWLTLSAALIALLAVAGYVYDAPALYRAIEAHWGMALTSAITLLVLSGGVLAARPHVGFIAMLTRDDAPGHMLRRLLPAIMVIPLAALALAMLARSQIFALPMLAAVLAVSGMGVAALLVFDVARRMAREALLQARLSHIVESSSDPIVDTSREGVILQWNPAAERMYGCSAAEMIGQSILNVVQAHERGALAETRAAILRDGCSRMFDGWWPRKDGSAIYGSTTLSPIRDATGAIVGISAITRDLTPQEVLKRVDEATHEISQALAALPHGDIASVLRVIIEHARAITRAQGAAVGFFVDPELPCAPWVEVDGEGAPPRPAHVADDRPDLAGSVVTPLEYRGRRIGAMYLSKEGPLSQVDARVLRLLAERAGVAAEIARCYVAEVTERAWLRSVIDQMPDPVMMLDEHGRAKLLNRAAQALLPGGSPEPDGQVRFDLRRPSGEPLPFEERPLVRALRQHETTRAAELLVRPPRGDDVPFLVNATPVCNGDELIGAVQVLQDISPLKELARLREEWTALVAHDLRQPVSVIRLCLDGLDRTSSTDERVRGLLARVRRATKQLDVMINDLLDLSRLEAHRLTIDRKPIELNELVANVVRDLSEVTSPHPVIVRAGSEPISLCVDPGRMTQVLGNLLSNAAKYSTPNSEIIVEVGRVGGESRISVQNRGRGILPEEMRVLFDRFWRSSSTRDSGIPGLGLGLPITKGLVEAHGGRIWAESIPGEVTTFYVALPLALEMAA